MEVVLKFSAKASLLGKLCTYGELGFHMILTPRFGPSPSVLMYMSRNLFVTKILAMHVGGCPHISYTITGKILSATSWNKGEYCSLLVLFCFYFYLFILIFRQKFRTFEDAELSAAVW